MRVMRNTGRTSMQITKLLVSGLLAAVLPVLLPLLTQTVNGAYSGEREYRFRSNVNT